MEENKESQQIHEQDHNGEDSVEEGLTNDQEGKSLINVEEKEDAVEQTREIDDKKVIPMVEEKQIDGVETVAEDSPSRDETSKKQKHSPRERAKPKPKPRSTVPQPFCLATEKRMSRERKASVNFAAANKKIEPKERCDPLEPKKLQPGLSKSVSLNHKNQSFNGARKFPDLKIEKSTLAAQRTRGRSQAAMLGQSSVSPVSQPLPAVAKKRVPNGRSLSMDLSSFPEKKVNKERLSSTVSKNSKPPRLPKSVSLNHKSLSSANSEKCSNPTHREPTQATNKSRLVHQVKAAEHNGKRPAVETTRADIGQGSRSVCKTENNIAASAKKTINKLLKNTRRVLGAPKVTAVASC